MKKINHSKTPPLFIVHTQLESIPHDFKYNKQTNKQTKNKKVTSQARKAINSTKRSHNCSTIIATSAASAAKQTSKIWINRLINFITRIFHIKIHPDKHKLLKSHEKIESSQEAWLLNLSLMREAAAGLKEGSLERKQIEFLAANYLHKTAPVHMKTMKLFFSKIQSMFQVSGYETENDNYHRFSVPHQMKLAEKLNRELALKNKSPLILTDTDKFNHLLPLKFHVIDKSDPKALKGVSKILNEHFSNQDPLVALQNPLTNPILFDLSHDLGSFVNVQGNLDQEIEFNKRFANFKSNLNQEIGNTVNNLIKTHPSLAKKKSQLEALIKKNMTCICRVSTNDVTGMKVLPLYSKLSSSNVSTVHQGLIDFVIATGIGIGAVNLRKKLLNPFSIRKDVKYGALSQAKSVPSKRLFNNKEAFTKSPSFIRLNDVFGSKKLRDENPHSALLGKATMDLLTGLFSKLDEKKWEKLYQNKTYADLLDTTLYKIKNQLATAEHSLNDFNKFAEQIELIQSELSTLLEITRPYKENEFQGIYKDNLLPNTPENLQKYLKAGLGKTATNVYAGINEAAREMNKSFTRVYSKGFYFEQAGFIGYDKTFDSVIENADPHAPKVDLYSGQFNSNVEIDTDFTHYERRDVAKDVKALLDSGKAAKHLTVAVDCTIDMYNSKNTSDLLQQFEKEIKEGRVNFIFFRSGQKMDMLGMDNYYGSPFYMVNNGAKHWAPFNRLQTEAVHKTDALSNDWFCLSNEFAKDTLENYRKLIFNNTRTILDQIPEKLQSKGKVIPKQAIRVNSVDEKIYPCFIDMKVVGNAHKLKSIALIGMFYQKMLDKGIKLQTRATFGLYHPNGLIISINEVKDSTTIRLHPGLNPKENEAFIEYFNEISNA